MRTATTAGAFLAMMMLAPEAWADPHRPGLVVQRTPESADCPDAPALAQAIEQISGTPRVDARDVGTSSTVFAVTFSRSGSGYAANIHATGGLRGDRRVEDTADNCRGLLAAAALTLSLLSDELRTEEASRPPPVEAPPPPETVAPPPSPRSRSTFSIDAGGGIIAGVVRPVAPEVGLTGEWSWSRPWSVELEAHGIPSQDLAIAPGTVHISFGMLSASVCLSPFQGSVRPSLCVGPAAGLLRASAEGFTSNSSTNRFWAAIDASLEARGRILGPLGWSLGAGPMIPLVPQAFSIEGLPSGLAYKPPPVALLAEAALVLSTFEPSP